MLLRRPQYRRFSYEPRFYNPEQDHNERIRRKMRQERELRRRKKGRPVIVWGIVLFLVLYAYLYLSGVTR